MISKCWQVILMYNVCHSLVVYLGVNPTDYTCCLIVKHSQRRHLLAAHNVIYKEAEGLVDQPQ